MRRIPARLRALRPTTAIVAALVAVLAIGGGSAVAARKYLITSTKQVSPKVLKKLKGKTGKTGARGATGTQGPTGPAGPAGADGSNGLNGTDGTDGTDGANGATGARGPSDAIIGYDDAGGSFTSPGVLTTISTLSNVPAGRYVYTAKFVVTSPPTTGGPYNVTCELRRAGSSNFDAASVGIRDVSAGDPATAEPRPAMLVVGEDAPVASSVTLRCSRDAGLSISTTVNYVKIEALRVENLSIVPAP